MLNKVSAVVFLFLLSLVFTQCGKTSVEQASSALVVDTANLQKIDSVPEVAKSHLKDTILKITADSVRALYYPNTGREVMKLAKGDVCKITRTGRYDVIDGKGNFWVRVERFGGKGWIFGGQTSLESDVWAFSEGMTERGHPYSQYKINKLSAPTFEALFKQIGQAVKRNEYNDEEVGKMTVDIDEDEILVTEKETVGITVTESFKPGPATDSIKSINYVNRTLDDDTTQFNHTFVAAFDGKNWKLVADFYGELKNIYASNGNHLLISNYNLTNTSLGVVNFTNVWVLSPKTKQVIERQRFGYSGIDVTGYPLFRRDEDGSFMTNGACTFNREGNDITMQIFETYNQAKRGGGITQRAFYITRYFTYNPRTSKFEESKQEVIYRGE
jgi:hypothetical protein